ncbi:MAG: extracellular solute-binding protein [Bacilli bacterium]
MKKKIVILMLIFLIAFCGYLIIDALPVEASEPRPYPGSIYEQVLLESTSYEEYLKDLSTNQSGAFFSVNASQGYTYSLNEANDVPYVLTIDGQEGLFIPEVGDVSWSFNVLEAGIYTIALTYYPIEGRSSEITRGLKINGDYPFSEATSFVLPRIWEDAYDVASKREDGKHDQKPTQLEKLKWNVFPIRDTAGFYYGQSYQFAFEQGVNTVTLVGNKEPMVLSSLQFNPYVVEKNYEETLTYYQTQNYQEINVADFHDGGYIKQQGEHSFEKSTPILSPVANWSSYKVDPYVQFMTRYNTIGGTTWRVAGDFVSWEVEVFQSGLYQLSFKVLQNYRQGMYSTRILSINGKVPFSECRNIQFAYDSDWQNVTLGNDEGAYLFYFEQGKNIITLEATIGVYADIVRVAEETITTLNSLYRKVVMIAGANPNEYQDYLLEERIDGLFTMIESSADNLQHCIDQIINISGERSALISSFERTLYQMRQFAKSERNIQIGLKELDDNIAALGTWVMTISEQSLAVDCFYIHDNQVKLPKAKTNFFQKLWHEIVMLFGSYGANTSLESSVETDGPTITVWISSGRDQSQLLRQLIDESFTLQKNVNVRLKLVSQTALLPATLSGNGPDVAIGVGQNIPVNWGIRNALLDLTQFSDYEEVKTWFHPSALTPFSFQNRAYGLPDTQDFLVSFVRTDIMSELNMEVPDSWNEVIDALPQLQRQYLDYYLPNSKGALSSLLYAMVAQKGGQLYDEEGTKTMLTETNATEAFIDFTTFFSDYGFEISANFSNRFRSGEMPIGVANFSLYNTLSVFAPEIRGHWEFKPLPGYEINDEVNNQTTSTVSGTVILGSTKEPNASWEFLKWWLGKETQSGYARGMEAILGAAARYPTANLEAFEQLPWSTKDYQLLTAQREKAVGVPTFPGDYIVGRYIDNAFRASINNNINPRDSLFEYCKKINIELGRKRQEFGLNGE